jgi:hypothetical protein
LHSRDFAAALPWRAAVSTTTDPSKPAWHRNRRSRRQRARHTILLWKTGCTVSPARLSGAEEALVNHHGTRGSDPMANGKGNGKSVDLGGGFKFNGRNVKPDEWYCPNAECQKCCPDPRGYYVFANKECCNRCLATKPKNPYLFRQSPYAKATSPVGSGGGKGGGKAGGGKGGEGRGGGGYANAVNESPKDKELRELQEKVKAQNQRVDDREKQKEIDRLKRELNSPSRPKQPTRDAESMEVEETGAGEGSQSTEKLELERYRREEDFKWWQAKLKDREDSPDPTTQRSHDLAKELFEKARQAWWDSQDPHEQMSKKTAKADRLNRHVATMEGELSEHMLAKAAAEKQAEECQAKVDAIIEKIEAAKAEMQRLHEESHSIREKVVGATPEGLGELVDKQCAVTLSMFDDPLLKDDETVRAKRPDVVKLTSAIAEALQKLTEINATVATGLEGAKEKAAKDAEAAAAEARNKEKVAADARKAADIVKPKAAENSSSASSPAKAGEQTALQAALAKPIAERNGEELVLTGRSGKVRKTEAAAADLDLANI